MRFARFGIFCGAGLTLVGAAGLAQNPSSEAWIISDTDGLRVVYRCDASGNGSVAYDRVDTFPGRCRRSGNNVTIETWSNRAEMTSGQKPVATLRLRVDGETAIGTSSDISGQSFRVDATLLGSRGHTAARMRQSTRQAEIPAPPDHLRTAQSIRLRAARTGRMTPALRDMRHRRTIAPGQAFRLHRSGLVHPASHRQRDLQIRKPLAD